MLVIGGDGFVGRFLCGELDTRGHTVTALSRHPDPEVLPDGVRAVTGDVTDRESLESAFEGVDAVANLVALSPLRTPPGGNSMHERIHVEGTKHALEAAQSRDVERFVQMSALGANPEGSTAYIRAKGRAEEFVRSAGLASVILRPSVIFGNGGEFIEFMKRVVPPILAPLPGGGQTRFQPIWVEDLAPILADSLEEEKHVGETYEIGGPETVSLREIARLLRGRILVIPIPMTLARVSLAITEVIPGINMGRDQFRSLQFDNTTSDNEVRAFGVDPDTFRTLEDYLRTH